MSNPSGSQPVRDAYASLHRSKESLETVVMRLGAVPCHFSLAIFACSVCYLACLLDRVCHCIAVQSSSWDQYLMDIYQRRLCLASAFGRLGSYQSQSPRVSNSRLARWERRDAPDQGQLGPARGEVSRSVDRRFPRQIVLSIPVRS